MNYDEFVKLIPFQTEESGLTLIANFICQDETILPMMMNILSAERSRKKELITDMNAALTRTTVALMHPEMTMGNTAEQQTQFYLDANKKFYQKYAGQIKTAGLKLWDDVE